MKVKDVIKEYEEEYANEYIDISYKIICKTKNICFIGTTEDPDIDDWLEEEVAHHKRDEHCTEYHITEKWEGPYLGHDYPSLCVNIEADYEFKAEEKTS